MSSKLMKLVALAAVFVLCATLVSGIPQLVFTQEEPDQQQETMDDEPLTRTRRDSIPERFQRDSIPAGGHHHESIGGHHDAGWGWKPQKHTGWGWPSVGPVFTYVRTDGWSNFQWGVRHKVGNHKGWGKR